MINRTKEIIIKTACGTETLKQSLKISLIVGTILNIINQGDYLFNMMFNDINYFKLTLTYFVPFCVSTYTAITVKMQQEAINGK